MKRIAIGTLVLLSTFVVSSHLVSGETQETLLANVDAPSECPPKIEVVALHTALGQTLSVTNSDFTGIAQRLQLTVSNANPVEIVHARVVVRGHTGRGQLSPAKSTTTDSPLTSRTFNIGLKVGAKDQASTSVALPGFTSIVSVNLDEVDFADDSQWHPSEGKVCHIPIQTPLNMAFQ